MASPLMLAASSGCSRVARCCWTKGSQCVGSGWSCSARFRHWGTCTAVTKLLLKAGAVPQAINSGHTTVHEAALKWAHTWAARERKVGVDLKVVTPKRLHAAARGCAERERGDIKSAGGGRRRHPSDDLLKASRLREMGT